VINFDQAEISSTVKEHLRMLSFRAGIREGMKRVGLARYAREDESAVMLPFPGLNQGKIRFRFWFGKA
jgi:hypothetical protein